MKVIDLLNKIANGESYNQSNIKTRVDKVGLICNLLELIEDDLLNVEISEKNKKIEPLNFNDYDDTISIANICKLGNKINELIDKLNQD